MRNGYRANISSFASLVLILAVALSAYAQPTEFTYQGKLTDTGMPSATYDFEFGLWNAASGGAAPLVTIQRLGITVSNGVFAVGLDFGAANFDGSSRWLEIAVKRPADPTFTTLTPRQPLTSTPYSVRSLNAGTANNSLQLGGIDASEYLTTTSAGNTFIQNGTTLQSANFNISGNGIIGGNIGIGAPNPTSKLEVNGEALVRPTGAGGPFINLGSPNGETGITIRGTSRADIRFDGSTLKLLAGGSGGPPASTNGIAINTLGQVGIGTVPTILGVRLQVDGGGPLIGPFSTGIYGSGTTEGVMGVSALGIGVYGLASGTDGTGLYGEATGPSGIGVIARGQDLAGFFIGDVLVSGNLTKQGGSFKIDHPLDPQNKYLSHSFVESPDMMNIYNGVVTLDSEGEAVVTLPGYFEALNRDFRYQLTCIGGFAPVYIAAKVENNRFKIAGGRAGIEVSWQVTGIRQDAFANAHRIPNEEEKPAGERGGRLFPLRKSNP